MKTLLIGLAVGGLCGFGLQKYVLEDEAVASRTRRETGGAEAAPVRKDSAPRVDVDLLLAKIRDLEARLAAAQGQEEATAYGDVAVPLTEEGIVTLLESFERTADLDQLLALIKALLLQGEKGYPRLTQVIFKMIGMGMANRFKEDELLKKVVPAARMAMSHEKAIVGYVGYLMTSDNVPGIMRTGAMGAAMFFSVNGVKGSESFAPKLLEAFMAKSGGDKDQRRMLLEAMGMLRQKEAVDPLLAMLADPEQSGDHRRAIEALGRIGDPRAVGPLIKMLQDAKTDDRNWWQGYAEMTALVRIGSPEALAAAENHLSSVQDNRAFFNQAGSYLRARSSDKVVGMLRDRFRTDPNQGNMWGAVNALNRAGTPMAREVLHEIATQSTQPNVKQYAQRLIDARKKMEAAATAVSDG